MGQSTGLFKVVRQMPEEDQIDRLKSKVRTSGR
jgi:hypothetical protein